MVNFIYLIYNKSFYTTALQDKFVCYEHYNSLYCIYDFVSGDFFVGEEN